MPTSWRGVTSRCGRSICPRWSPIRRRPSCCGAGSPLPVTSRRPRVSMAAPSPGHPSRPMDRRLMPRPLPAHLASAMLLWASSRAALPSLSAGLPLSNLSPGLRALRSEIARAGLDRVAPALDRELSRRAGGFLTGLETYRRHAYRRIETPAPVIWHEGTTRLLDYGEQG